MFLWCAYTAPFLKPFDSNYLITSFLYIGICAYYFFFLNNPKQNIKPLCITLGIMIGWWILQCVKVGSFTNIDFRLLYSIIICHIAFSLYKGKEFFWYFEKVLVHLTIISLVVWFLGTIARDAMYSLVSSISVWDNGNTTYGNMIVVGLGSQRVYDTILRNIGFTWEAGRFSSFLVVGLFNNLLIHNFKFKSNKPFFIFLIGLITTFSTTGIGAALGVLLLYVYNKSMKIRIFLIVLCILLFPSIFALDFIGGKIRDNIDVEAEVHNMEYSFNVYNTTQITPQRFTGLYLDLQNWLHDFWLGYNLNENSYVVKYVFRGSSVWLSDGIIQIFSKYGLFVGLFFYWQLFKSSIKLSKDFNYKGTMLFALAFILISVSYDFWSTGIMLYFILYALYKNTDKKRTNYNL